MFGVLLTICKNLQDNFFPGPIGQAETRITAADKNEAVLEVWFLAKAAARMTREVFPY